MWLARLPLRAAAATRTGVAQVAAVVRLDGACAPELGGGVLHLDMLPDHLLAVARLCVCVCVCVCVCEGRRRVARKVRAEQRRWHTRQQQRRRRCVWPAPRGFWHKTMALGNVRQSVWGTQGAGAWHPALPTRCRARQQLLSPAAAAAGTHAERSLSCICASQACPRPPRPVTPPNVAPRAQHAAALAAAAAADAGPPGELLLLLPAARAGACRPPAKLLRRSTLLTGAPATGHTCQDPAHTLPRQLTCEWCHLGWLGAGGRCAGLCRGTSSFSEVVTSSQAAHSPRNSSVAGASAMATRSASNGAWWALHRPGNEVDNCFEPAGRHFGCPDACGYSQYHSCAGGAVCAC
jgi:hypothetical protein